MEEARIPRDLVQRGHHELGIGKGLVVKVDLDLQEFPGQAEVVILDRVFQRRNVLLYGRDFFEELCEFLSFAAEDIPQVRGLRLLAANPNYNSVTEIDTASATEVFLPEAFSDSG